MSGIVYRNYKGNGNTKIAFRKQFLILIVFFVISLILSAIVFFYIGQGRLVDISYNILSRYTFIKLFLETLKRNILYFIVVTLFALFGRDKLVYAIFVLLSVYFGISMIYLTKVFSSDKMYFLYNISDFLIYYPIVFYYTNLSLIVSKYIKKLKKVETKRNKLDIIEVDYIKVACIFVVIIILYSCIYSLLLYLTIPKLNF